MSKIHLLHYNNYFNRRVLLHSSLASYVSAQIAVFDNINFKPNDGAYTEITLNLAENLLPDYLVVSDKVAGVDTLTSRWFILERKRLRDGQCRMTLRRDVLVDFNTQLKNARIWCEKGYVSQDDPLIYNSEGNTYNQIKTTEHLLKDGTGSAWLIGYCDRNLMQEAISNTIDISMSTVDLSYSATFNDEAAMLAAFPTSQYSGTENYHTYDIHDVAFYFGMNSLDPVEKYNMYLSPAQTSVTPTSTLADNTAYSIGMLMNYLSLIIPTAESLAANMMLDQSTNESDYELLAANEGIVVRVGTGLPYKYYRLDIKRTTPYRLDNITSYTRTKNTLDTMLGRAAGRGMFENSYVFPSDAKVAYKPSLYCAYWADVTEPVVASIADNVPLCATAPYYMFAIPYSDVEYDTGDGVTRVAKSALSMPFVQTLIQTVGTHVLDVQLLPYFPDQYLIHSGGIDFTGVDPKSITYIEDTSHNKYGFIYWGAPQTFSAIINDRIEELPNRKVDNETRFCRLTAPNYSASYDFSIAKNQGVSSFRVTCTYRPYQPHVQVMPEWSGIYGQYFRDARGLICGGDFSIDIVNDAWTEYQINNKNYQLIFDRQIQSMDIQHDVQRMNERFSAITSVFSAAAAGSITGAAGGPAGMATGGLAAGLLSTVGAALDIKNNEKLRTDQRSAAFDMFNYNLGNIQARPTTITKLSALAGNNKIFPFYEIYSATSREVSALEQQLLWSGMTVNTIGYLKDFIGPSGSGYNFVRGRIIRITGLDEDAHIAQIIADELARGVYMNY